MQESASLSLNQALSVLDQAAGESVDELKKLMKSDYRRLRRAVVDIAPELRGTIRELADKSAEALTHARENVVRLSSDAARNVDRKAHQNPWPFVAGAAAATAIFGFWLGRKTSA